jgi:hypothetical protein
MKNIFVSYASEDVQWTDRVLQSLHGLQQAGRIKLWRDVSIRSGDPWRDEILRQIGAADAFLVLASESYQRKPFIYETEFPRIRDRVNLGGARLFWIPLDHACLDGHADGPMSFLVHTQTAHGTRTSLEELNEQSLRGAPHLADALLRVQSRVKEWLDEERRRGDVVHGAAAASPLSSERLARLERLERRYLQQLVDEVQYLTVAGLGNAPKDGGPSLRSLPLREVYITLRADPTTLEDRLQTRALHRELAGLDDDGFAAADGADERGVLVVERRNVVQEVIAERDAQIPWSEHERGDEELVLEHAFRKERVLVILGDPGSGKSVLCRWLALQLARRPLPALEGGRREEPDLGPPRVPVLLRIAELNAWVREHVQEHGAGVIPDLMDALARYAEVLGTRQDRLLDAADAPLLLQRALDENRAVILLDGMDEVPDARDRELVADAVEHFASRWILRSGGGVLERLRMQDRRGTADGNQLVVTSRITGYHLAPLRLESDAAAHYLIRPLDDERVRRFCANVARLFDDHSPGEDLGRRLLADLEGSLLPGLDRLKRTPLLLASLVTYWYARRRLPRSRAELYHALLLDLCARWRDMEDVITRLSDALRAVVEDGEQLLDLLGVIAREVHLNHPSGRIARTALTSVVRMLVGQVTVRRPLELDGADLRAFDEDVRGMLALMSTQVGALVEVAPDVFGFLHPTFREYLVGRNLLAGLGDGAETALVEAYLERVDEPRWREPLLFAFGETGLPYGPRCLSRSVFLDVLRHEGMEEARSTPAGLALFIADLVAELPPEETSDADLRETFRALAEAYRLCGPAPALERERERIAERMAELRRRGGEPARVATDRRIGELIATDAALAPALAYLYWVRRWLVPEVLDAFASALHADSGAWGWPMHRALSWVMLPPEGRLGADPVADLRPPPTDAENVDRARRRVERAYPAWERMKQAHAERVLQAELPAAAFPLRAFFAADPPGWERLISVPANARAVAALLGPADDWGCIHWSREYVRIVQFLQRGSEARELLIDLEPEAFLPRWGADDAVYGAAVYLDTNPGGRFRFASTRPVVLASAHITRKVSTLVDDALRHAARTLADDGFLHRWFMDQGMDTGPEGVVALLSMGVQVDEAMLASSEVRWALERARDTLDDAVLRAGRQGGAKWFSARGEDGIPGPRGTLTRDEVAVVYGAVAGGIVAAAGLPHPLHLLADGDGGQEADDRLRCVERAEKWAEAFSRTADDIRYTFAVCLDTLAPGPGWTAPLSLLARLCMSANAALLRAQLFLPAQPLWGVSPSERLVPPEFFDVLRQLSLSAASIDPEFGAAFADMFLAPLPLDGLGALQLVGERQPSAEAGATEGEAGVADFWLAGLSVPGASALPPDATVFAQATLVEHVLRSQEPDPRLLARVAELGTALMEESPVDGVLFLARMAALLPEHDLSTAWTDQALQGIAALAGDAVRADVLARMRGLVARTAALANRHTAAVRSLASPVLRTHAAGRLGRFLASPEFAWNDPELLGTDAGWVVTCVYAALNEALRPDVRAEEPDHLWLELARAPGAERIERLVEASAERGLLCSSAAVAALDTLRALPSAARAELRPERVIALLRRGGGSTVADLRRWLDADGGESDGIDALLAGQAAVLLAEASRDLQPEWVEPLFRLVALGDDVQAGRAEFALASSWRSTTRDRRFRSSRHGIVTFRLLAGRLSVREEAGNYFARRLALLAVNDWVVDSPQPLAAWCSEADAGTDAERALLGALRACDRWSPECQQVVAEWLTADRAPDLAALRREVRPAP